MPTLPWTDALSLNLPLVDDPHRDFVHVLAAVEAMGDAALPDAWRHLVARAEAMFAAEDRWMQQSRFASAHCHCLQHQMVLRVLRETQEQARLGDASLLRQMAREFATWFALHLRSMDADLARHLRRVDYDAKTGTLRRPEAVSMRAIACCRQGESLALEAA